jgi:DNA-binding protein YbaB
MFDKMKALMEMQKKMQELKRELENTVFEIASSDQTVKISMSGAQEIKGVSIQGSPEKAVLESALKDCFNRAIKRAQEVAAQKMKSVTGMNIPGLT